MSYQRVCHNYTINYNQLYHHSSLNPQCCRQNHQHRSPYSLRFRVVVSQTMLSHYLQVVPPSTIRIHGCKVLPPNLVFLPLKTIATTCISLRSSNLTSPSEVISHLAMGQNQVPLMNIPKMNRIAFYGDVHLPIFGDNWY